MNFYIGFLSLFMMVSFSACTTAKRAKILLPSAWLNMQKIAPHVYVESDMKKEQREKLLKEIPYAKQMLKELYGSVITQPIIYACATEYCAESLGLEEKIRAIRLLGYLVLRPTELLRTTVVHEWSHEELYQRIGGFFPWYREIPVWFDEGLATLVMQKHSRYDEEAWRKILNKNLPYPQKDELMTLGQWSKSLENYLCNDEIVVSYATARHMVATWYTEVGQEGFLTFLNDLKDGKKFTELYPMKK